MPKERVTYFTYNEGLEAKKLHLGNLVHDYRQPNSFDPYVETAYTDIAEPAPAWATSDHLENYALTLGKISPEDYDAEHDSADRYAVAAAAKTTKLEIKDPKKFFNEVTLKSIEAKKWLSSRLSAAESLPPPRPQIWMLTGLVLMTHATWTSLSSKEPFTPGTQAPFDPTGVSTIRRLSVSEGIKPTFGFRGSNEEPKVEGTVIHETGKYPGTRGWAAQWQRVDAKIESEDKWKGGVDNQLSLKPPKIAVVGLHGGANPTNEDEEDEDEEGLDDEQWEAFLDAAEENV